MFKTIGPVVSNELDKNILYMQYKSNNFCASTTSTLIFVVQQLRDVYSS